MPYFRNPVSMRLLCCFFCNLAPPTHLFFSLFLIPLDNRTNCSKRDKPCSSKLSTFLNDPLKLIPFRQSAHNGYIDRELDISFFPLYNVRNHFVSGNLYYRA